MPLFRGWLSFMKYVAKAIAKTVFGFVVGWSSSTLWIADKPATGAVLLSVWITYLIIDLITMEP